MITVLIQALAVASLGVLSPGSITIVIVLLMSDRGWRGGVGYASGYLVMYAIIGFTVVGIGYRAVERAPDQARVAPSVALIVLGILLLALALRAWRRPTTGTGRQSRLFALVDRVTPAGALAFGAAVALINLKNLAIFLAALSVLLDSALPLEQQLGMVPLLVLLFCASVIAPVLIFALLPGRAGALLSRIRRLVDRHSRPIGIAASLILGIVLLARGISRLL